ncbi:hypothetical protein MRB53_031286 [Persea americana]|uniref:Uncharacterized protein n=1 Tax=Persea americana TaxID=3435 RepID=A0ACC2KPQ1_PERAE|nr:hypothetical protein MRB53_031286 [Persea americana]
MGEQTSIWPSMVSDLKDGNNNNFNKKGSQGHSNSKGCGFTQFGQQPNHGNNSQNFQGDNSFSKQNYNVLANKNERPNQPRQERQKGAICQIYNKPNHTVLRRWNRFYQIYQPKDTSLALAAMTLADHQDNAWFLDTGASATFKRATNSTSSLKTTYCGPQSITTATIIIPLPQVVDDPNSIGTSDFTTVPAAVPELEQSQPIEIESSQAVEIESSQPTIVHVNGSNLLQPSNISLDDNTSLFDEHIEETVSLTPPATSNTNEGSSCES